MAKFAQLVAAVLAATGATATGDASVLTSEIGRLNNQSLLWGPYKPNLYFGVRPRTPKSLWTGLLWGRIETYGDVKDGKALPVVMMRMLRSEEGQLVACSLEMLNTWRKKQCAHQGNDMN